MNLTIDTDAFAFPETPIPQVWTLHQRIRSADLQDIEGAATRATARLCEDKRIQAGGSVAVGVGSRGIANLDRIVKAVVAELKRRGARPFIVPAMGSHGGATAEGQQAVLESYGITADRVGADIHATMEVKQVGALEDGYPVYFDCNALGADAVIVVNRIKPHTDFHGPVESGPSKMCAIGLGKQKGASTIHRFGADGLTHIMPRVARKLIETCPIVGGVAILENQYGRTAEIHALPAQDMARDPETRLLDHARELMPRLPFDNLDVLVIDEMGKEISGTGMDTNVIGRADMPSIPAGNWSGPYIRCVCVLDITDRSHGNASGLGLADFTTQRLIERCDFPATFTNSKTSHEGGVRRLKLPVILKDARACVQAAIATCGKGKPEDVRLARIRNTEVVETLEVSAALLDEARKRSDVELEQQPHTLEVGRPLAVKR